MGLLPLLYTRFSTLNGFMLSALLERWHEETNNFHLSVRKMTAMLDDVACLINIHIKENMMDHEEKISKEMGVLLTNQLLGVVEHRAIDECDHQFGDYKYSTPKENI